MSHKATPRALLTPGTCVVLTEDADRFPHFIAKAGSTGVVVHNDEELAIKMDDPLPNCDEWDNCVCWHNDAPEWDNDAPAVRILAPPSSGEDIAIAALYAAAEHIRAATGAPPGGLARWLEGGPNEAILIALLSSLAASEREAAEQA